MTSDEAALPLFVRVDGERLLLVEDGARLALKGRDGSVSEEDVVARLESGAWLPSFSALTRPLAASVLFPVAATVLGPAEVAYWAQSWPLFAWAGIVPPAVLLRPLVALETPAARRGLAKLGVTLEDVLEGEEALLRKKGAGAAGGVLARVAAIRDRAARGARGGARGPPRRGSVARQGDRRDGGEARVLLREARREDRERGGPRGRARPPAGAPPRGGAPARRAGSPSASIPSSRTSSSSDGTPSSVRSGAT